MIGVKGKLENGILTTRLSGKIDSLNAAGMEKSIRDLWRERKPKSVILDFKNLDYITSAGLRVILRLKGDVEDTRIVNASPAVYDILDMTGFTEILEVEKASREISVEGCEVIGQGANGKVYRIDRDTIVKVYLNPDSLPDIQRERDLARTAFVAGVPTAIPYDVVRITGGGYGSVFELLDADSLAELLIRGEKTVDEAAEISVKLLRLIHSRTAKPDTVRDMKAVARRWVADLEGHLPADLHGRLRSLVDAVPEDMHLMHGDYHLRNVMLQNGESLLIDMDTLAHGHPVFEFSAMYNAYAGYGETDHSVVERFLGIPWDTAAAFWKKSLQLYFGTEDESALRAVENKVRIVSHARIMRHWIRRNLQDTDAGRAAVENSRKTLEALLPATDTLVF